MEDAISDTDNLELLSHVEQLIKTNEDLESTFKAKLILARDALEPQRLKLQEDLERLQKAVVRANRDIDMFDAVLAPIRGLSPDILLEIFDLCLPTKSSPRKRMKALLALSHVTSSWRAISLGTPILWTSVFISLECSQIAPGFGELEPSPYQASKESMLEEWFSRAGTTAPLSLVIEFHHTVSRAGENINHSPAGKSLMALVKPYAARIQHLRLTSCDIIDRFFIIHSLSILNTLQSLVIQRVDDNTSQLYRLPMLGPDEILTFDTPASPFPLHRLKIASDNLGSNLCRLPIPWNQLTHLSISSLTNRIWYPLLRGCKNLVHGNFGFSEVSDLVSFPVHGAIPIVRLDRLTSLSLSFHKSGINPRVMNNLSFTVRFTALRLASKRVDHRSAELWRDAAVSFWPQIQKVEELGIYAGVATHFMGLLPFLVNAWNVKRFELQTAVSSSKILDVISSPDIMKGIPETLGIVLPKLQHLSMVMTLPQRGRHWVDESVPTFPAPFSINTLRKFFSMRAPGLVEVVLGDDYAQRVPNAGMAVSESLREIVEKLQDEGHAVKVAEKDPYLVEEESGEWEYLPHRS